MSAKSAADMEAQLVSLYQEKRLLEQELGASDAAVIVRMVRSMEAQLDALYAEKEAEWRSDSSPSRSSSGTP